MITKVPMMQHAKGPWTFRDCDGFYDYETETTTRQEVTPDYSGQDYGNNPGIFDADGNKVIGCGEYNVFYRSSNDQAANVRLLLAAPDLLEACQALICAWEGGHREDLPEHWIREAVAKATGGAA